MKALYTIASFMGLFFLGSCGMQQPLSVYEKVTPCLLDYSRNQLVWTPIAGEDMPDFQELGTTPLPSRFQALRLDQDSLIASFRQWQADATDTIRLALPLPDAPFCLEFDMIASGTLSDALSRKYPELLSLKGVATNGGRADARIDFDGKHLAAELRLHYETYVLSAWSAKRGAQGETIYLLYLKSDSGVEPKPRPQD